MNRIYVSALIGALGALGCVAGEWSEGPQPAHRQAPLVGAAAPGAGVVDPVQCACAKDPTCCNGWGPQCDPLLQQCAQAQACQDPSLLVATEVHHAAIAALCDNVVPTACDLEAGTNPKAACQAFVPTSWAGPAGFGAAQHLTLAADVACAAGQLADQRPVDAIAFVGKCPDEATCDPILISQVMGWMDGMLATLQDALTLATDAATGVGQVVDDAATLACDATCITDAGALSPEQLACHAQSGAGQVPVLDLTVPDHPKQADCTELEARLATAKAAAAKIDCSALQAAWAAAQAQADAAAADAQTAADAEKAARDALTTANDALTAATQDADAKAQDLADYAKGVIGGPSVAVGADGGGLSNAIGVGPIGGAGSVTFWFDGSSASQFMLSSLFASPAFQAKLSALNAARKAMNAAAEAAKAAAKAHQGAEAAAKAAAQTAAAAAAAAAAAKAALDACLGSAAQAAQQVQAAADALDLCKKRLVTQTQDALDGAGSAVKAAGVAAGDAALGGASGGDTEAAGAKAQEAEDTLEAGTSDQAAGDYDAAQTKAAKAAALAGEALDLLLGPCQEGQEKRVLRRTYVKEQRTYVGYTRIGIDDWRGVHGQSKADLQEIQRALLAAADKLLDAPATSIDDLVGGATYGEFQRAALASIKAKLAKIEQALNEKDAVMWIRFKVSGRWRVTASLVVREERVWRCTGGVWRPVGIERTGTWQLGQCEALPDATWLYTAPDFTDPLSVAVPQGIRAMEAATGWLYQSCPG